MALVSMPSVSPTMPSTLAVAQENSSVQPISSVTGMERRESAARTWIPSMRFQFGGAHDVFRPVMAHHMAWWGHAVSVCMREGVSGLQARLGQASHCVHSAGSGLFGRAHLRLWLRLLRRSSTERFVEEAVFSESQSCRSRKAPHEEPYQTPPQQMFRAYSSRQIVGIHPKINRNMLIAISPISLVI